MSERKTPKPKSKSSGRKGEAQKKREAEEAKKEGNEAMATGNHYEAFMCYSRAISLDPSNHIFWSNRAAARLACPNAPAAELEQAVADAREAEHIYPTFAKAYHRGATALLRLGRPREAFQLLARGMQTVSADDSNDLLPLMSQAEREMTEASPPPAAAAASSTRHGKSHSHSPQAAARPDRQSVPKSRTWKCVFVGERQTGKTSWIERLASGRFVKKHAATTSPETRMVCFATSSGPVMFELCDVPSVAPDAGHADALFDGAHCAIVLFDVTSHISFRAVTVWRRKVLSAGPDGMLLVLAGNKVDVEPRKVRPRLVRAHVGWGIPYFDVSVRTAWNVIEPLQHFARVLSGDKRLEFAPIPELVPELVPNFRLMKKYEKQLAQAEEKARKDLEESSLRFAAAPSTTTPQPDMEEDDEDEEDETVDEEPIPAPAPPATSHQKQKPKKQKQQQQQQQQPKDEKPKPKSSMENECLCPFCSSIFTDPLLLSCGHSMCHKCCDQVVAFQAARAMLTKEGSGAPVIICARCNAKTPVPKDIGTAALPKNKHLAELVAAVSGQPTAASFEGQRCANCEAHKATSDCLKCNLSLCDGCWKEVHSLRAFATHPRSPCGTIAKAASRELFPTRSLFHPSASFTSTRATVMCSKHPEQKKGQYCATDDLLVCTACAMTDHGSHKVVTVADFAAEVKKLLEECSRQLSDRKARAGTSLERIVAAIDEAAKTRARSEDSVRTQFQKLAAAVEERRVALLAEVDIACRGKEMTLAKLRTDAEAAVKELSKAAEKVTQLASLEDEYDLIEAKKTVAASLADQVSEMAVPRGEDFSMELDLGSLADAISKVGIVRMVARPAPEKGDPTPPATVTATATTSPASVPEPAENHVPTQPSQQPVVQPANPPPPPLPVIPSSAPPAVPLASNAIDLTQEGVPELLVPATAAEADPSTGHGFLLCPSAPVHIVQASVRAVAPYTSSFYCLLCDDTGKELGRSKSLSGNGNMVWIPAAVDFRIAANQKCYLFFVRSYGPVTFPCTESYTPRSIEGVYIEAAACEEKTSPYRVSVGKLAPAIRLTFEKSAQEGPAATGK